MSGKIFNFKRFHNNKERNKYLFALEYNSNKKNNFCPINIKRIFFIKENSKKIRGNHAHIYCSQLIICLNGSIEITLINKHNIKKKFLLSDKYSQGLLVPPYNWNILKFKKKNTLIAVLCDYKYDKKSDYINSFDKFIKCKKKS